MDNPKDSDVDDDFDLGRMAQTARERFVTRHADHLPVAANGQPTGLTAASARSLSPNVLQASDNTWLAAIRIFQGRFIDGLQKARASILERFWMGLMQLKVIRQLAEEHTRFLGIEAHETSETALKARKSDLDRDLKIVEIQHARELAKSSGEAIIGIEAIWRRNVALIQSNDLRDAYTAYVMEKILHLIDMEPPQAG